MRYSLSFSLLFIKKQPMKHSLLAVTLFTVFTGCTDKAVLCATDEHNKQLVRTYFNEAWNKGNVSVLDTLLSKDYINHTPSVPNPPQGPEGLKPIIKAIRTAFPDLHYEIKDLIATPDRVVARVPARTPVRFLVCPPPENGSRLTRSISKLSNMAGSRAIGV